MMNEISSKGLTLSKRLSNIYCSNIRSNVSISMIKSLKYYFYKSKYGGLFTKIPMTLLAFAFSILLFLFAEGNITPSSVSVKGYYRSDGTYVRSYNRRPPGSLDKDAPYEVLRLISLLTIIPLSVLIYFQVKHILKLPEELIPPLPIFISQPENLLPIPDIPNKKSKAKKIWFCKKCNTIINPLSYYWYYKKLNNGYNLDRIRFCELCKIKLEEEKRDNQQINIVLQPKIVEYESKINELKINYFIRKFGKQPSKIDLIRVINKINAN